MSLMSAADRIPGGNKPSKREPPLSENGHVSHTLYGVYCLCFRKCLVNLIAKFMFFMQSVLCAEIIMFFGANMRGRDVMTHPE
jgi:hypothetical protein